MSLFIDTAWAQQGGAQEPSLFMSLLPLIILFALLYFLLIRPQQKRQKEHRQMVADLEKGDEVMMNGGLLGRITELGDDYLHLEIADNVVVKAQRGAVANVLPRGTIKSA